jgi:DTW domain-containing protein
LDIESFKQRRRELQQSEKPFRELCVTCLQPGFGCYCAHVKPFDPKIKFVILINPIEVRRRIATGRMSYLSLQNSELIPGQDYSSNERVNQIIEDPKYQSVVLYPGRNSQNLTEMSYSQKDRIFSGDRKPVVFVIDGTWATARKTMAQSQNLKELPRVSFTPPGPSQFRVRKQPGEECYSTIEAIHHTIHLLGPNVGFDLATQQHDGLIHVFNHMVERQLDFIRDAYDNPRGNAYRRPRNRIA